MQKAYEAFHIFKKDNSTLFRTVFLRFDENKVPLFENTYSDVNGTIKIQLQQKFAFVDEMYSEIDSTVENSDSDFKGGYAIIKNVESGKFGMIDSLGNVIIEPQYTKLSNFSERLAYFAILEPCMGGTTLPNKMGYVDCNNKRVIELPKQLSELYGCCYFHGENFINGITTMRMWEFGFDCNCSVSITIDKTGKILHHEGELLDVNYVPIKVE